MQTEVEVTNRFNGLSLIDTVPEDLLTEAPDTVQEEMIKTISKKKEMQKGKVVVWGGLKNIWKKKTSERQRREGKIDPFECRVPKKSQER